jgi:EAL domain-containing protein (putative c-di-GMP-specific phosphodiesterase class I)
MAFWSVTHHDGDRQVYLCVQDDAYGKSDGDSHTWSDSFCRHMVAGVTPQIAPDAMAVAPYAAAGVAHAMPIGAYIGVPIRGSNGELFGTLCGLDPHRQPGSLHDHASLLTLCATLLSQLLHAEHLRLEAIDREAKLHWIAFHDVKSVNGTADILLREPLRAAIESGAIEAYYQAIIDLRTARPIGFEALARWRHNGEIIGPDVFIPIAARSGLLPALTERMFDLACAQTAAWSDQLGHHDLRVGVNVPADCISDPGLPARVAEHLQRHALQPHQLTLEITEEALLADLETAATVARRLRDLDVRIVLDDFGRGFSSLLHLHTLPLQSIKIDRGFILEVDTNAETRRFMRALRNLSRDLELAMVVEGVERETQADALRELGCTYVQGHLYGLPAPPGEINLYEEKH